MSFPPSNSSIQNSSHYRGTKATTRHITYKLMDIIAQLQQVLVQLFKKKLWLITLYCSCCQKLVISSSSRSTLLGVGHYSHLYYFRAKLPFSTKPATEILQLK